MLKLEDLHSMDSSALILKVHHNRSGNIYKAPKERCSACIAYGYIKLLERVEEVGLSLIPAS
jgi:hypothetical protein